jgi:hypothetical protein
VTPGRRSAARRPDPRVHGTHLRLALLGIALWTVASLARAGITIHFEGAVASDAGVQKVVDGAAARAQRNGWRVQRVGAGEVATLDSVTLKAMEEIEGTNVPGEWRGVVLYPHEMCEPLYLVFGAKRKTKNHVKTQFAGADVHVKVVELLEALKPMFAELELDDEGEYASTHDRAKLERHLAAARAAMDGLRVNTPGARGPVKRPDGRILDIVR